MIKAGIELLGDWAGTEAKLRKLPRHVTIGSNWANNEVANEIFARVVGHIYAQDLAWEEHSLSYSEKKIKKYGHLEILLASEKYVNSIKVYKEPNKVSVGVKPGIINPVTKVPVWKIALWLEHGTKNMPARPVWSPVYQELGGAAGIDKLLAKYLNRYLRVNGYKTYRT